MDWYYFWYVNKRKVWMMGLLFIILAFVVSLVLSRGESSIQITPPPKVLLATTTHAPATSTLIQATQTTTTFRATTTTDQRVTQAKRRMETEIFCIVASDCSGKEHPLCNGFWTCESNSCMWYCWS